MMKHILFVNKNSADVLPLIPFAEFKGVNVSIANSVYHATTLVESNHDIDIIIADMELPDGQGLDLLKSEIITSRNSKMKFFLSGKKLDRKIIKHARLLGAEDILSTPITIANLENIFNHFSVLKQAVPEQGQDEEVKCHFADFVGTSPAMQDMYRLIRRVAPTSASVFIIGESGTGKELVARAIHQSSDRAKKPFVAINCGAISSELISSALFGHEKGSFTGALNSHKGYFEQANGGTLFLDEITETSEALQVRLLRVLETGSVIPVGGKRQIDVDVRVIASTNRCPKLAVKQKVLRADLYYRLNVFPIRTTPLNMRREDIPLLAQHFLVMHNKNDRRNVKFSSDALELIRTMEFPGNVRELKNLIHRAYILADKTIECEHVDFHLRDYSLHDESQGSNICLPMGISLRKANEQLVQLTLKQCNNNRTLAAQMLAISEEELNSYLS